MTGSEYTTGLYARYQVSGTIASNDGLLAVRIASVTGGPCLPVGGATTPAYSPPPPAALWPPSGPVSRAPTGRIRDGRPMPPNSSA